MNKKKRFYTFVLNISRIRGIQVIVQIQYIKQRPFFDFERKNFVKMTFFYWKNIMKKFNLQSLIENGD